jgi:hypothetical protein
MRRDVVTVLKHWRLIALAVALLSAFLSGLRLGSEYQLGRQARDEAARLAEEADSAKARNRAEALRLIQRAEAEATYRSITDEARADPDGALPAIGLRDAKRLNAIR